MLEAERTRDQRTVYVGQLVQKVRDIDVERYFEQVGKVSNVQLIIARSTGRSTGVAYVEFETIEAATNALILNGQKFCTRHDGCACSGFPVLVKPSEADRNYARAATGKSTAAAAADQAPENRLYVGNLHPNIGDAELASVFQAFGPIVKCEVTRDAATGASKGYGFVHYTSAKPVMDAIAAMNGVQLADRNLRVANVNSARPTEVPMAGFGGVGMGMGVAAPAAAPAVAHAVAATAGGAGGNVTNAIAAAQAAAAGIAGVGGAAAAPGGDDDGGAWTLDDDETMKEQTPGSRGRSGAGIGAAERASLMARLAARGDAKQRAAAEAALASFTQPAAAAAAAATAAAEATAAAKAMQMPPDPKAHTHGTPSNCFVLRNMFDPSEETEENWEDEIRDETVDECSKFGAVLHAAVDKMSAGHVYVMFSDVASAAGAAAKMAGRYFAKKIISVEYIEQSKYVQKWPEAASAGAMAKST